MPVLGDAPVTPLYPKPSVVDDEFTPRSIVCRMVRNMGYPVQASKDGRDALRYLKQHPNEIRLLIADLILPVMDGGELAERACELQPKLQIALMATDPAGSDAELLAGYPEFRVLQKPVTFPAVYRLLGELAGPPTGLRHRRHSSPQRRRGRREEHE
ncbi:MAG TPA: response regulator [Gemmatimonadales bacterium]|jgi:CheY-like chemotaxis protein|nr:response regulator [Gemmatimonadales bacterium]